MSLLDVFSKYGDANANYEPLAREILYFADMYPIITDAYHSKVKTSRKNAVIQNFQDGKLK